MKEIKENKLSEEKDYRFTEEEVALIFDVFSEHPDVEAAMRVRRGEYMLKMIRDIQIIRKQEEIAETENKKK